jgi:hypothetical protein
MKAFVVPLAIGTLLAATLPVEGHVKTPVTLSRVTGTGVLFQGSLGEGTLAEVQIKYVGLAPKKWAGDIMKGKGTVQIDWGFTVYRPDGTSEYVSDPYCGAESCPSEFPPELFQASWSDRGRVKPNGRFNLANSTRTPWGWDNDTPDDPTTPEDNEARHRVWVVEGVTPVVGALHVHHKKKN